MALGLFYWRELREVTMAGREVIRDNEKLLRAIIRSIDKNLDYTVEDVVEAQAPRFALQLSLRGRKATVSLSVDDLKSAGDDVVRKNTIRQKIKSTRDHMMDNHLRDVTGKMMAKMLRQSAATDEDSKRSFFRRSPRR